MSLDDILHEIFPSKEMADYLSTAALSEEQISEALRGAPISLSRKRELFYYLAENNQSKLYLEQASNIDWAIQEMKEKPNDVFYVKDFWLDTEMWEIDPDGVAPFLTIEQAMEGIREFRDYEEFDENTLWWFGIEKWSPDETGKLRLIVTYYVFENQICYFRKGGYDFQFSTDYFENANLNLPVPFRPGDIVKIDCRPFAPVIRVVILEVGDNNDCCCLQALFPWGERWNFGAVKHGHVYPKYYSPSISPLYRISTYHGPLTDKEQILLKVSSYLQGDDAKGRALWNFMDENRSDDNTRPVDEILAYIECQTKI